MGVACTKGIAGVFSVKVTSFLKVGSRLYYLPGERGVVEGVRGGAFSKSKRRREGGGPLSMFSFVPREKQLFVAPSV